MIKTLEMIRYLGWTLCDFLSGSIMRKQLKDIEFVNKRYPDDEALNRINERMNALLTHAVKCVPYYSANNGFNSLIDFPVVNKNIIRERYNEFQSKVFEKEKLKCIETSGSTGTPFRVLQDNNKRLRNSADTLYFSGNAGYKIGERIYYLRAWNSTNIKRPLVFFAQNMVPVNVFSLSEKDIEKFVARLINDKSTIILLGYVSSFEVICRYLDKINMGPLKTNVKSVIAIAEALDEYTGSSLKKYFGVPVVSRYSNMENGMIAQQSISGDGTFEINHSSYYIEILDNESDSPLPLGKSGRIVLTDLFNYSMPLIRYDTGDIGIMVMKPINGRNVKLLAKVEGRKADMVYDTAGHMVSHFAVSMSMRGFDGIKQYQFIQTDKNKYQVVLNCSHAVVDEMVIIERFKNLFGEDATIDLVYINEIPLLSSGKRKRVVNKYASDQVYHT